MNFEILGLQAFNSALLRVVAEADEGTRRGVSRAARRVQRRAQEKASGAPGPGVVSGSLRRGIRSEPVRRVGGHSFETRVGPTMIYSRRIELGFRGSDSLGRIYNQQGRPYFTPAWREVVSDLPRIYAEEWRKAIAGA